MFNSSLSKTQRIDLPYQSLLLTGATGVLGAHLLKELLLTTNAKVYCLIRADSPSHAVLRLLSLLKTYDPFLETEAEFKKRVVPVIGDISEPQFGLDDEAYQQLTREVEATIHSAALTNLFLKFRTVEPVNVGGTGNVIEFALKTASRYLCHISSHTVMGDLVFKKGVRFRENEFDRGQGFKFLTYQQSKFLSEKLVRDSSARGLQWNIMRPGQIFGESTTGYYPLRENTVSGLFYDIFKTVAESRVAMDSETYFDVVPVDYVSAGIIALGLRDAAKGETYHFANPETRCYSEVIRLIHGLGYPMRFVTQDEYRELLLTNSLMVDGVQYKSSTTSAFRWWFRRGIEFNGGAFTDCDYTRERLKPYGISCPLVDQSLIRVYVEAAIRETYMPPPTLAPARRKDIRGEPEAVYEVVT